MYIFLYTALFSLFYYNEIIFDSQSFPIITGVIFNESFTGLTELFPDLPDSDLPDTTLAMHQSPDGTMYWIVDREGKLLRVGDSFIESVTLGATCADYDALLTIY